MPLFVFGAKFPRSSSLFLLGFLAVVVTASSDHKEAFDGSSRDNAAAAGCSDGDTTAAMVLRGGHGVDSPTSAPPAHGVDLSSGGPAHGVDLSSGGPAHGVGSPTSAAPALGVDLSYSAETVQPGEASVDMLVNVTYVEGVYRGKILEVHRPLDGNEDRVEVVISFGDPRNKLIEGRDDPFVLPDPDVTHPARGFCACRDCGFRRRARGQKCKSVECVDGVPVSLGATDALGATHLPSSNDAGGSSGGVATHTAGVAADALGAMSGPGGIGYGSASAEDGRGSSAKSDAEPSSNDFRGSNGGVAAGVEDGRVSKLGGVQPRTTTASHSSAKRDAEPSSNDFRSSSGGVATHTAGVAADALGAMSGPGSTGYASASGEDGTCPAASLLDILSAADHLSAKEALICLSSAATTGAEDVQAVVMEDDAGQGAWGREDAAENEKKGGSGKRGLDGPDGTPGGQARERKKPKQTPTSRDSQLQQTPLQSSRAGEGWRWLEEARARSAADSAWLQRCIAQEVSQEWEYRLHALQEMVVMLLVLLLLSLRGFFPGKSAR